VRSLKKEHRLWLFLILGFIFLLSACGGLQKDLRERAEKVPSQLEESNVLLEKSKKEYDQFKKTDEYKSEFNIYASPDRENWGNNFLLASDEISRANEVYKNNLVPLLDRNDNREQIEVRRQLKKINDSLKQAGKLSRKTKLRIGEINEAKNNADNRVKAAKKETDKISNIFQALALYVGTTQDTFPHKKEDLDTRLIWFRKTANDTNESLKIINSEFESDTPDYGFFSDNCTLVSNNLKNMYENNESLRTKISELERDYSKILRDMKLVQRPWVEEVKYQWNNWSDYDTTKEVYRQKKDVSMDDYNQVVNRLGDAGGIISRGSDYEIWIEDADIEEHFYHKYLVVENEKENVSDWVEVSEKIYEANEDNLNMSILSKPFGYYEDEVIKVATPPGYDKVGDPKYGKWVENRQTGEREWSFFQRYLFWHMVLNGIGPRHNYYTYGRWNDWNSNYRGRRAYYGSGGGDFGSAGRTTSANPKVRNSTFAKSGGFKASRTSVRGAGSSGRGRGPGSGK